MRRWKNRSLGLSRDQMEEITMEYVDRLTAMRYSQEWRQKVLLKALVGYGRVLRRVVETERGRRHCCKGDLLVAMSVSEWGRGTKRTWR